MDFFKGISDHFGDPWVIIREWKNLKEEIENKSKSENQELLRQLIKDKSSPNYKALKLELAEIVKEVLQSNRSKIIIVIPDNYRNKIKAGSASKRALDKIKNGFRPQNDLEENTLWDKSEG